MKNKTVIVARRRSKDGYWEGYSEYLEEEVDKWVEYYRNLGEIVEVFKDINDFRADCRKKLEEYFST